MRKQQYLQPDKAIKSRFLVKLPRQSIHDTVVTVLEYSPILPTISACETHRKCFELTVLLIHSKIYFAFVGDKVALQTLARLSARIFY